MYGPRWQMPRNPQLTIALLALWLLLAVYIVWTRNPLGYIILALIGVFVLLPALIIWLGTRRARQRAGDEDPGEGPGLDGHRLPPGEDAADSE
jgi:Flp pilus assembly protein TadB